MNIEKLLEKLRTIFSPESAQFLTIRDLLLSNPLDPEEGAIKAEDFLITAITTEKNKKRRNIYKSALDMVLHSRGYFTDELGDLEKTLFLIPFEQSSLNPNAKNSKYPLEDPRIWLFINKIRIMISNCIDQAASPTTRMQDKVQELFRLIKALMEKLNKQGPDSLDECHGAEIELAKQLHLYQLNYLKVCLSTLRNRKILKTTVEQSIWASAVRQAVEDLTKVRSAEFVKTTGGGESKLKETLRTLTEIHERRINYFMHRAKLLFEPFGFHAEATLSNIQPNQPKMITPRGKKAYNPLEHMETIKLQSCLETQTKFLVDVECFVTAHALLMGHQQHPEKVPEALNLAARLVENNNPLGIFIEACALTLMTPPTKERWNHTFERLQDIVIPACWRFSVAELWLCLSEYFVQHCNATRPFYRDLAITCTNQIIDRFGEKAFIMGRLQLARILKDDKQVTALEMDLQQLKPNVADETPRISDTVPYAKLSQYLIAKLETFGPEPQLECYLSMMLDDNPPGLETIIKLLLNHASPQRVFAVEAVQKKYGEEYVNPLKICQGVLRKKSFDRYLMIWGPIYCDALDNNLLKERIDFWQEQGLSPNDIKVKLYAEIRSYLYPALYGDDALIPGGRNFLVELDRKILEVTLILIKAIEENPQSTDFVFCRDKPGLIYAIFAELALQENNWYVAEMLAQLAIARAGAALDHSGSPRKSTPSTSPPAVQKSITVSPEVPQKNRLRGLNFRSVGKRASAAVLTQSGSANDLSSHTSGSLTTGSNSPQLSSESRDQSRLSSPRSQLLERESSSPIAIRPTTHSSPTKRDTSPRNNRPITPLDLTNLALPGTSPTSSPHVKSAGESGPRQVVPVADNIPSTLGYLMRAIVIWNRSLKGNNNRDKAEINRFKESLEAARKTSKERPSDDEELCYIKGMIWWNYFDSGYDELWLIDEDREKYKRTLGGLREARRQALQTDERKRRYTIIKIIRDYWVRALKGDNNPSFKMFPPAAVAYEKYLWYWVTDFDFNTKELETAMLELASLCDEADEVHGHTPAAHSSASIKIKCSDTFRKFGTLLAIQEECKLKYDKAARHVMTDAAQEANFNRRLNDLRATEHQFCLQQLEEKERTVTKFGVAINSEDYPSRDAILSEIKHEFKNDVISTLRERILDLLRQKWCTEELRQWFSRKSGCEIDPSDLRQRISLATLQKRFELIINSEFNKADPASLEQRILAKVGSELSSLRQPVIDWLMHKKVRGPLLAPFQVARLLPVSRNFNHSATIFLTDCRLSYSQEEPKLSPCTFTSLPFQQKFLNSEFTFARSIEAEKEQNFCLEISCAEGENFPTLDLLLHCFQQAQQVYCYSRKVTLVNSTPVLKPDNNRLIISHLDIAIFGCIRLIQGRHQTGKKIRDSQLGELVDFL